MARSRETLLLPGLLVAVLLLVAAPGDAAAARGCQPAVLAPTVALFRVRRLPTGWRCQALAPSARVGGGARCLCRLAAGKPLVRAALNATDLLRLYAACAARCRASHAPAHSACDGGRPCCEAVAGSARRGAGGVPSFCHVPLLRSSISVYRISSLHATCVGSRPGPGAARHLVGMCPRPGGADGRA